MAWQAPKTDWEAQDGVRNTDLNRIEGNTLDLHQRTTGVETGLETLQQTVENKLFELSQRTDIANIAIGNEFGLYENGILTPFIKLVNNYANSGRVLVVRKDIVLEAALRSTGVGYYGGSSTDTWLNDTYINMLDELTQSVVQEVAVPVQTSAGVSTIDRKCFLLSMQELNLVSSGMPLEGPSISYFNGNNRRIARFGGVADSYWTRTINVSNGMAAFVNYIGSVATVSANTANHGIRPAFTLPSSFEVTAGIPSTANVMAEVEVID